MASLTQQLSPGTVKKSFVGSVGRTGLALKPVLPPELVAGFLASPHRVLSLPVRLLSELLSNDLASENPSKVAGAGGYVGLTEPLGFAESQAQPCT